MRRGWKWTHYRASNYYKESFAHRQPIKRTRVSESAETSSDDPDVHATIADLNEAKPPEEQKMTFAPGALGAVKFIQDWTLFRTFVAQSYGKIHHH